jgi:uncharacterized membrane protein YbhN (UPF0104 family)
MPTRDRVWAWLRLAGGATILVVLLVRVGAEPFVDGLRQTRPVVVLVALVVTALTTACAAWRWSLLSERLDVAVPLPTAYRLYYRSQLLNATLPGGIVGDVHRAIDHGRTAGALGRGIRSVVWDRASGQAVQAGLALAAVVLLPVALRTDVGLLFPAAVAVVGLVVALAPPRVRRQAGADARAIGPAWPPVVLASVGAAAGHVVVFVVAARSVGVDASLPVLGALALVVMLASALPLNVAGWGPREGATAWLFAEAGLGASTGVSVAVVYGVVSLVATLPGLVLLVGPWTHTPRQEEVAVGA